MIDHFREFIVLADTLNFRTAAARLFVTQPTLSRHIAKLEEELGAPLFTRTTTSVALTAFGASILPDAREMTACYERVLEQSPAHRLHGTLRIGGFIRQPAVAALLKRAIDRFRSTYPDVDISVTDCNVADPTDPLLSGSYDVMLSPRLDLTEQTRIAYRDLFDLPVNVWVNRASPLAAQENISLLQLGSLGLVTSSTGNFDPFYAYLRALFDKRGLRSRIARRFVSDYDDELADDEYTLTLDFPPELHHGIVNAVALPLAEGITIPVAAAYLPENERRAAGLFAREAVRVAEGA